ncbi:hypothetical protein SAMN05421630_11256 [Prauserella marina]|uniref:Uncharacterized protein n=1 Tax=Prauserella marina TaxID=530584 RepID=A0A1G6XEL5_9PSEU|nr:hypothetical protein DES30_110182 [Prauserella marina]SDD76644.1 hypothetical protein SAMN05421630_11256 [Prauserella marina]
MNALAFGASPWTRSGLVVNGTTLEAWKLRFTRHQIAVAKFDNVTVAVIHNNPEARTPELVSLPSDAIRKAWVR